MRTKLENTSDRSREPSAKALARYAANVWITERMKSESSDATRLSCVLRDAAQNDWNGYRFSASTLERNYYKYRKGGFASLETVPRSDQGQPRKLPPDLVKVLLERRRAHPRMPVTVLVDELALEGVDLLSHATMSSVHRLLRDHGLDRATIGYTTMDPAHGPQKAFEMPCANMLWMTDMMYGPVFKTEDGQTVKSRLFALIDDHSRLCPAAVYFDSEALDCFLEVMRDGLRRRGLPDKIYTDCGSIYTSLHLQGVCARLGIKLSHAQPYHAWSKGKIERFFRTVQEQFQSRLALHPVHSLAELNQAFSIWLQDDYHQAVHSATGHPPAARFAACAASLRNPPPDDELLPLFMRRVTRRVRRDGCISVEAIEYEAPLHLRGMNVEVRYHAPPDANPVEIWFNGKLVAQANRLNKTLNATQFKRKNP